jgi:hypothetical protein
VASVTTTDVFASVALMQATTPATGTIGYVVTRGKATGYVYLTTAGGADVTGWHKLSQR